MPKLEPKLTTMKNQTVWPFLATAIIVIMFCISVFFLGGLVKDTISWLVEKANSSLPAGQIAVR